MCNTQAATTVSCYLKLHIGQTSDFLPENLPVPIYTVSYFLTLSTRTESIQSFCSLYCTFCSPSPLIPPLPIYPCTALLPPVPHLLVKKKAQRLKVMKMQGENSQPGKI